MHENEQYEKELREICVKRFIKCHMTWVLSVTRVCGCPLECLNCLLIDIGETDED